VTDAPEDDEYADTERAHLIVRKSVAEELLVQGRNVTITVDIFNAGNSAASDVKLEDTLPQTAQILSGSPSTTFAKISAGSHVKHTYTVSFGAGGAGVVFPIATVNYKADADGTAQVGYSSTSSVYVLTPVQQITRYALIAGTYVSLGIARTPTDWRNIAIVAGVAGSLLLGNWAVKQVTASRVTKRRQRALNELEKSD